MPDRRPQPAERPTDPHERAAFDAANLERFERWRATGDTALRDQLVVDHGWIATRAARRFADRGEPYDDLHQVASLGLFKAVERFDPEVGSSFLAFAMPTVVGEIRRHFRDHTWSVRVPRRAKDLKGALTAAVNDLSQELGRAPRVDEIADRLQVDAEVVLETMEASAAYRTSSLDLPPGEQPSALQSALASDDADLASMVDRAAIGQLLAELPKRERRILYLRFFEQMSQAEIAAQVGTSQVHVGRLLHASLAKLRAHLDEDDLS
ncbi:MAG: SigB/SigF/SigG family RNA polymerase sigma factor [Ilumatobacteraceae bacterium]